MFWWGVGVGGGRLNFNDVFIHLVRSGQEWAGLDNVQYVLDGMEVYIWCV